MVIIFQKVQLLISVNNFLFIVCQKTTFEQPLSDLIDQYVPPSQVFLSTKKVVYRGASYHGNFVFVFQAIDDDCNQTGQMLSALLNWPQVTGLNFFPNS